MTLAVPLRDADVPMPTRFAELSRSPLFDRVIAMNRLYVAAAIADAPGGERDHWALSCLPSTGGRPRFSALAMDDQEVFTVFRPHRGRRLDAKVIVSLRVLDAFGDAFDGRGLERANSPYLAAGDDQVHVFGDANSLSRALSETPLRTAARALAERLLPADTTYARFHDHDLAARVLARS